MKYAACTAILGISAVLSAFAASPDAYRQDKTNAPALERIELSAETLRHTPIQNTAPVLLAQSLPNCGNYDGSYCPTPGASFRCQWAPYEPGRCRCSTGNVWACG